MELLTLARTIFDLPAIKRSQDFPLQLIGQGSGFLDGAAAQTHRHLAHAAGQDGKRLQSRHPVHLRRGVDRPVESFGRGQQPSRRVAPDKLGDHAEADRYGQDHAHAIDIQHFAACFPLAERKANEAVMVDKLQRGLKSGGKFRRQLHVIFQHKTGVDLLIDDGLPCLAMRQKAGNLVGAEGEGVVGLVHRAAINALDRFSIEHTPVNGVDHLGPYGQAVDELRHLRLAIARPLQMDDEGLHGPFRAVWILLRGGLLRSALRWRVMTRFVHGLYVAWSR